MDKTKAAGPPPRTPAPSRDWREAIFKYRGMLLLPIALVLIVFGRPSLQSALLGLGIAVIGELLRIWAVGYAGDTTRGDAVTARQLVTAGPYALMRNPLYLGNVLIAVGFTIALSGAIPTTQALWLMAFVLVLLLVVYASVIPLEEEYLARTFGMRYTEYTTLVPRFLPWRGPLAKAKQQGTWRREVIRNSESITLMFFILMVVVVVLKITTFGGLTIVL
jgi:protein-S-isoprenylcysteine O-methyltransferase Ste14